jgi:hypothetical protein
MNLMAPGGILTLGRSVDPDFFDFDAGPCGFSHEFKGIKFYGAGARANRKAGTENAK